jgi:DNA-directed RNA polymerase specialized sigma24 family protein
MTRDQDRALIEDYTFMREHGESQEAAARRLGLTVTALERRLTRARQRLAEGSKQDVREAA